MKDLGSTRDREAALARIDDAELMLTLHHLELSATAISVIADSLDRVIREAEARGAAKIVYGQTGAKLQAYLDSQPTD